MDNTEMTDQEVKNEINENLEHTEIVNDTEKADESADISAKESDIDPVQKLQSDLAEVNDKYIRLVAEFDNYKKRMAKDKIESRLTAGQDILRDLLPVLDDLDRAEKAVTDASDIAGVKEGFDLIKDKLLKNLAAKGLKEMEVMGELFDSDKHEAVAEFPAPTEDLKGKIFDVTEKGYVLNDRIIRFPKVVVSK